MPRPAGALNTSDDTSQHEAELMSLESEVERVVDAIAQVGVSPALKAKLQDLEQRKRNIQTELEAARRPVAIPNCSEVHQIWTGLVE